MNRISVWQEFNACQFIVSFCLLNFSILFGLRKQSLISWSYWFVFLPLFVWKGLAILGALIGILTYCCIRSRHRERNSPIHCRALFLSLIETILLLLFELLTCYKLEHDQFTNYLSWVICFTPLIILSIISVFTYVWLLRHGRSWEIQALFVINILQFIFLALKLDEHIVTWRYAVVFIPFWIVMGISISFCMGRLIWTYAHYYRNNIHSNQMNQRHVHRRYCQILASSTVGNICVLLFLLLFQILLTIHLERSYDLSFIIVCLPLYIALSILIYLSFNSRVQTNHWWFGLRQDICGWLLHTCPLFATYANIEYHFNASDSPSASVQHVNLTTIDSSLVSAVPSNRNSETIQRHYGYSRRFFFMKKKSSSSSHQQTKTDNDENEMLTTIILPFSNNLKLHEPD